MDFSIRIDSINHTIHWQLLFNDHLQQNSNADSDFIISVAHELKNSLGKIQQHYSGNNVSDSVL